MLYGPLTIWGLTSFDPRKLNYGKELSPLSQNGTARQ